MCAVVGTLGASNSFAKVPEGVTLAKEQVLRLNTLYPSTIDPNLASWSEEFTYVRNIFSPLARQGFDGIYHGEMAESWSVSEDGLTWTFKLRDAKWSDGVPVRAQDFEYSWKRLTDPKTAAQYGDYLSLMNVVNAEAVFKGEKPVEELGVKALDDKTFEVKLVRPTPWLLQMSSLNVLAPVRQDVVEKYGKDWTKVGNLVTNGAYNITRNELNDVIVMSKSETYWDAANTTVTEIETKFIQQPTASYFGFLAGDFTFAGIPPTFKDKAQKELPDALLKWKSFGVSWLEISVPKVPDVRVRKAIALLVDRKTYTDKILRFGIPTTRVTPDNIIEGQYIEEQPWFSQSMAERRKEAIALLTEAGYTKEKPFEFVYTTGDIQNNKFYIALRSWLEKETGNLIKVTPRILEGKVSQEALQSGDYDIASRGWNADYNHVSTFLNTFTCSSVINSTKFCDKEYDALLTKATTLTDPEERAKVYAEAAKRVMDAYVWIPYLRSGGISLKAPNLFGFNINNEDRYFQDYYFVENTKEAMDKAREIESKILEEAAKKTTLEYK